MASLIRGFEYDIFISYRQKDNKYDGWVTEFVDNLTRELEATFKEDVSIYFDISPHDGLLETHDVEASLKNKLKCLVFIPIISRTYCDPKSFAWEHEFKAFVEQSSNDQFGLKVKLPNGNVASRVLPVRIHDLDKEDIKLCESVLGGYLRGVEFVYREPGVNKPLTSEDDEKKNLSKTKYRIQINKAANAISEIISGMRTGETVSEKVKITDKMPWEEDKKKTGEEIRGTLSDRKKLRILSGIFTMSLIAVLFSIYIFPKIFKRDTLDRIVSSGERIAIAVMPFQNMTNDSIWDMWREGIQQGIISALSNNRELMVRQKETFNNLVPEQGALETVSISPGSAGNISQKLDADIYVYGSLRESGKSIHIDAQLIDTRSKEVLQSFTVDRSLSDDNMFPVIDTISERLKNFLILSKMIKKSEYFSPYSMPVLTTNSPEAFRYYTNGTTAIGKGECKEAVQWYLRPLMWIPTSSAQ
jgi:TolB-like protein